VPNLSDVPALGISWLAMRWAERPADTEKTYGYHRAGTLAAFTNALVLCFFRCGSVTKPWNDCARRSTSSRAG